MIKRIAQAILALSLCFATPAASRTIHGSVTGVATGKSTMNLALSTVAPAFLNILKSTQPQFGGGATPATAGLDNNFIPTRGFTGYVLLDVPGSNLEWPGEYLIIADPGLKGPLSVSSGITGCANVSGTGIVQSGNCGGIGTATFTLDGVNAGMQRFTPVTGSTLTFIWPGDFPVTGVYQASQTPNRVAVIRNNGSCISVTSDCYLYTTYRDATINGAPDPRGVFTYEALEFVRSTGVATLRPMGDTNAGSHGNSNTDTLWANRPTNNRFTFGGGYSVYPTGVWSGGWKTSGAISHSGVATGCTPTGGSHEVYTALATDDTPSPGTGSFAYPPTGSQTYPYAYGTTVQGILGVTNSTATPELCFGTRSYPIYMTNTGQTPFVASGSFSLTAGLGTFFFDPWLNPTGNPATTGGWWYVASAGGSAEGGNVSYIPFEVQIGMANYLNKNWWPTIPLYASDDYVTQMATLTNTLLLPSLYPYFEWGNEIWHNSWWAGKFADARGKTLGFGSRRASYQSLRVRQVMGDLVPAGFTRPMRRELAIQGGSASALAGNTTNICILQGLCDLGANTKTITNITSSATTPTVSAASHGYNPGQGLRTANLTGTMGALLNGLTVYVSPTGLGTNSFQLSSDADSDVPINTSGATYSCSGTCSVSTLYSTAFAMPTYQTTPNRAVDKVERLAQAPYVGGANLFLGADILAVGQGPDSFNTAWYQALVNAWEAGTTATTRSMIDADIQTGRTHIQNVTASGTLFSTPLAHSIPVGANVAFQVTGGTTYSGLVNNLMYYVSAVSSAGCAGAVTCNLTLQPYVNGAPSGVSVNAGSAGTGTTTIGWIGGGTGNQNISTMQYASNFYSPFMEALAAQFDGARPAGMANLGVDQYEGNQEPVGPTFAQCGPSGLNVTSSGPTYQFKGDTNTATSTTTISNIVSIPPGTAMLDKIITGMTITGSSISASTIGSITFDTGVMTITGGSVTGTATGVTFTATGNCQTSIALALYDYKMSATAQATQKLYYQQSKGLDPNMPFSSTRAGEPSHLVLLGGAANSNNAGSNSYGLLAGALPGPSQTGFAVSPVYKWRDGIYDYNTNWLLKRDIDPASNDNDPMWLEKAA